MALELVWLGHGTWSLAANVSGKTYSLVVDPFLDEIRRLRARPTAVPADFVLLTHGHFDHVADAGKIAKRTGATVLANYEICEWLGKQGVEKTEPMKHRRWSDDAIWPRAMTIAHHSSTLPDGTPGGNPGGFLLTIAGQKIYLRGRYGPVRRNAADRRRRARSGRAADRRPVHDGPDDALEAVKLLNPKRVVPCHYNTWAAIAQDAKAWAERVRSQTKAIPYVLEPGGEIDDLRRAHAKARRRKGKEEEEEEEADEDEEADEGTASRVRAGFGFVSYDADGKAVDLDPRAVAPGAVADFEPPGVPGTSDDALSYRSGPQRSPMCGQRSSIA